MNYTPHTPKDYADRLAKIEIYAGRKFRHMADSHSSLVNELTTLELYNESYENGADSPRHDSLVREIVQLGLMCKRSDDLQNVMDLYKVVAL